MVAVAKEIAKLAAAVALGLAGYNMVIVPVVGKITSAVTPAAKAG